MNFRHCRVTPYVHDVNGLLCHKWLHRNKHHLISYCFPQFSNVSDMPQLCKIIKKFNVICMINCLYFQWLITIITFKQSQVPKSKPNSPYTNTPVITVYETIPCRLLNVQQPQVLYCILRCRNDNKKKLNLIKFNKNHYNFNIERNTSWKCCYK